MRVPGLRARVSIAFGVLSLIVALVVSVATYELARVYLTDQRESAGIGRALTDAQAVTTILTAEGGSAPDALNALASVGGSQRLLRLGSTWYSSGVSLSPDDLPSTVLATTSGRGAHQRFDVGDRTYLGVAVPVNGGVYVEVFPLDELNRTLNLLALILAASALAALVLGTVIGRYASGRLLRPLRRLVVSANQLAEGDLTVRMAPAGDRDLESIPEAFNDMAQSVEDRIERERRFVANVSHELRTPVTVVLGTSELLAGRANRMAPEDAELLALLDEQVGRLGRTVLDLLDLYTTSADNGFASEPTDVARTAQEVLADRGIDLAVTVSGADCTARTDERRLTRILANLVDNARTHGDHLVALRVDATEDFVEITVDDGGEGIPDRERDRIFEPFQRGSGAEAGTGSGLGLAIVREQSRAIGARLEVAQAPNGGARFRVVLPKERS